MAVLSAMVRESPEFDPAETFDRALFGLAPDEVLALGTVLPHVCEVAYEALELAGIGFDRLRTLRVGTFLGVSDPQWVTVRDAPFLAELFGLPGPAHTVLEEGAGLLLAVHQAAVAIRAGDIDVALVAGDHLEGVGAAVLASVDLSQRADLPAERGGRLTLRPRALLLGSGSNRIHEEVPARSIAAARAGVDDKALAGVELPGMGGLVSALLAIESGETQLLTVAEVGEASVVQVVLKAAEAPAVTETRPRILGLSARTRPALRELVRQTLDAMRTEEDLYGIGSDALGRPGLEHRLATPIRGLQQVRDRLESYLRGETGGIAAGYAVEAPIAFVVPPAGAQYAGMGDVLYGTEPVFREALNRCDVALRSVLPRPLLSVMFPARGREVAVDDPIFANPITFSFAFALSELYRSRGVHPDAVLGCGTGELAAAAIAGAVSVEDAVRVSAERGRLLVSLSADAARAVISAPEAEVRELFADDPNVDVVALPMPERVVIGGTVAAVGATVERAQAKGLRTEPMTGHPNNTPLVEPILGEFSAAAASLQFQTPEIGWVSAATGRRTEHADASHWAATLRSPMRFTQGVETLYALGCRTFLELAPRPTLLPAGERTLANQPSWWFAALDPARTALEGDDRGPIGEVLAAMWVVGASGVDRGPSGHVPGAATLPTYPWDRRPLEEEEEGRRVAELVRVGETGDTPADEDWLPDLADAGRATPVLETLVPADERGSAPEGGLAEGPLREGGGARPALASSAPESVRDLLELPQASVQLDPTEEGAPPLAQEGAGNSPDTVPPQEDRAVVPLGEGGVVEPPVPDAADVDGVPDLSLSDEDLSEEEPVDEGDLTLDDITLPGTVEAEVTPIPAAVEDEDPDPTSGFLDDLEDIEVDAYSGRTLTLAEAEALADAEVLWEERWILDELPEAAAYEPATWVILVDAGGVGDYTAALLEGGGHRVVRVLNEQPYPREDRTLFVPDPTVGSAWEPVVEALGTLHGTLRILHLWALDASDEEVDPRTGWSGVVGLIRELRAQSVPARLHLVTRGAVRASETALAYAGGSLWGLASALAVEAPFLFGGIVDLDPDDEDPEALLKHLLAGGTDARPVLAGGSGPRVRSEHVFRNGQRWRRALQRVQALPEARPLATDGAWVICGDVDAPALELAQHLANQGVKRIFLISPQAPTAEVLRGVLELQRKAVGCIVVRADPTESKDVVQVRSRLQREPRICGVVLRIAAAPALLSELDLEAAIPVWQRILALTDLLGPLARDAARWLWSEGRAMDGVAGGGVPAIAGGAVAARLQSEMGRAAPGAPISAVIHSGAASELSPGQAVRLVGRLGAIGGVHGIWRER
ncbi:MAG: acyltransferase domain-containing protein [Myxococcota bacterium]